MSFASVRDAYSVPAKRGARVTICRNVDGTYTRGTVKSADHYVRVLIDGEKKTKRFHPTSIQWDGIAAPQDITTQESP